MSVLRRCEPCSARCSPDDVRGHGRARALHPRDVGGTVSADGACLRDGVVHERGCRLVSRRAGALLRNVPGVWGDGESARPYHGPVGCSACSQTRGRSSPDWPMRRRRFGARWRRRSWRWPPICYPWGMDDAALTERGRARSSGSPLGPSLFVELREPPFPTSVGSYDVHLLVAEEGDRPPVG